MKSEGDIWVFAEQVGAGIADVSLELLGKACSFKGDARVCAVLLGPADGSRLAELALAGAEVVYHVENPVLRAYDANLYASAIEQLVRRFNPNVLLAGATAVGRSFLPRVAAGLATGLTADCTALEMEDGQLLQTRPAFGGNIMATILTPKGRPQMATVRPGVFKQSRQFRENPGFTVLKEAVVLPPSSLKELGISAVRSFVDLSHADVLVAGGRGLKGAEGFALLERLASLLGGEVAATRAAVDAGWVPASRQVGQTGQTVAPKLYLAFGISGAIQHLEGIRGAERVIAVNTDPDAPLFASADLAIVGDAQEVARALIKDLEHD